MIELVQTIIICLTLMHVVKMFTEFVKDILK